MEHARTSANAPLVQAVRDETDQATLAMVEALAHAKRENAKLRSEREWLARRIAEEDVRLAHA